MKRISPLRFAKDAPGVPLYSFVGEENQPAVNMKDYYCDRFSLERPHLYILHFKPENLFAIFKDEYRTVAECEDYFGCKPEWWRSALHSCISTGDKYKFEDLVSKYYHDLREEESLVMI